MNPPPRIAPVDKITRVELERLVQCARDCRDRNLEKAMRLTERRLTVGYNVHENEALLALENDNYVLSSAIEKLWALDLSIPILK